ncbi:MAG: dihydrofolate synthase / folylpolyglutamate synthase, partial [Candidatus Hydrogenedentes bacterium]|nr:dihydrofolate synthase / folylpolyglutamate synthase [Candidatus Hydrogenedentota bacterium]
MLDAILRAAGYTVGRFTSPHLIDLNERFLVNGEPIANEALDEQIDFFRTIADAREWWPPTFFEMTTVIAFRWFDQREVDCAIIEVGLGGRFDATNIITPEAVAITNIELDHTKYLGDTLPEIAFEKAGIIKPGRPVVVGETKPEPRDVILARAAEMDAPVRLMGRDFTYELSGPPETLEFSFETPLVKLGPTPLGLVGRFQGHNAAIAVTLALDLVPRYPKITAKAIETGLREVCWPCR